MKGALLEVVIPIFGSSGERNLTRLILQFVFIFLNLCRCVTRDLDLFRFRLCGSRLAAQLLQVDDPSLLEKCPLLQAVQLTAPLSLAAHPGRQALQTVEPTSLE